MAGKIEKASVNEYDKHVIGLAAAARGEVERRGDVQSICLKRRAAPTSGTSRGKSGQVGPGAIKTGPNSIQSATLLINI